MFAKAGSLFERGALTGESMNLIYMEMDTAQRISNRLKHIRAGVIDLSALELCWQRKK